MRLFDHLDYNERIKRGKSLEKLMFAPLQNFIRKKFGSELSVSSPYEDKYLKYDSKFTFKNKLFRISHKSRVNKSYDDIVVNVFEPFYDIKNSNNRIGRDMLTEYEFLACLAPNHKQIRLIDAKVIKKNIYNSLSNFRSINNSEYLKDYSNYGIKLSKQQDKASKEYKLLAFVSPTIYKLDEEMWIINL